MSRLANADFFRHHSPALEKDSAGNASPNWSGKEPLCSRKRLFYAYASGFGRLGGEGREALPMLHRSCKPRSVAHPIARGMAVQNRNWSKQMKNHYETMDEVFVLIECARAQLNLLAVTLDTEQESNVSERLVGQTCYGVSMSLKHIDEMLSTVEVVRHG
jgi:hypothetical protein